MNPTVEPAATAVCILGMHRSGTSSIARAINLLGAYIGEDEKMMAGGPDNPPGFWEHTDIGDFQARLLATLNRTWDTTNPLPEGWHRSEAVRPMKEELKRLVQATFGGHPLWVWKDPRTCLFMPLWREVLEELNTRLVCVFMTRNPMEVAESMNQRDTLDLMKALGVWFNYNISALNDTAGVPAVFVGYDEFLADWEKSLRRCATLPGLAWPADDRRLREAMSTSIRPDLRHHRSATAELQAAPRPVEELYGLLCRAGSQQGVRDTHFEAEVRRLTGDFKAWAATLPELMLDPPRPGRLKCTWLRWRKSFRKRFRRGAW